jgi:cytochrome c-type biogenesis protein
MDAASLQAALEQAGIAALAIALLAGFLFSFNPVALAAIPVSLAYVTKAGEPRRAMLFGGMFVLGMVAIHALLGLIAGLGGSWVQQLFGRAWGLALGPLLIVLGAMWLGWLKIRIPVPGVMAQRVSGPWGAFWLGAPFSVAVCPVCTPTLLVMLGVSAALGSALYGLALLVAFALGRAVPIAIGALAMGWLERLKPLHVAQKSFERFGGVVLILAGLYMLNAYFMFIPALA